MLNGILGTCRRWSERVAGPQHRITLLSGGLTLVWFCDLGQHQKCVAKCFFESLWSGINRNWPCQGRPENLASKGGRRVKTTFCFWGLWGELASKLMFRPSQFTTHKSWLARAALKASGRFLNTTREVIWSQGQSSASKQSLLLAFIWRQCWAQQYTQFFKSRADCIAQMVEERLTLINI